MCLLCYYLAYAREALALSQSQLQQEVLDQQRKIKVK